MNLFQRIFGKKKEKPQPPVREPSRPFSNQRMVNSFQDNRARRSEEAYTPPPFVPYVSSDDSPGYSAPSSHESHHTDFGGGSFGGAGASSDWGSSSSDSGSSSSYDSGSSSYDSGSSDCGSSSAD
jgi:hypothetical protein